MPNSPDDAASEPVSGAPGSSAKSSGGADSLSSPLLAVPLPVEVDESLKFAEPWEAKAFAIIVKLAEAGRFTWSEWVDCFSREVAVATAVQAAGGAPKSYYEQWLNAAETLLVDKGLTSRDQLFARAFAVGSVGSTHVMK